MSTSLVSVRKTEYFHCRNQSVEKTGAAFVKEAYERNEFFENISKQYYMTNKSGRTRQRTNNLNDELIWE